MKLPRVVRIVAAREQCPELIREHRFVGMHWPLIEVDESRSGGSDEQSREREPPPDRTEISISEIMARRCPARKTGNRWW
jgi:hypothetical protein